jgi:hypothetical protein
VVAESYERGAVVSEVARGTTLHLNICLRGGLLVLPAEAPPRFVPVVTGVGELPAADRITNRAGSIVIESVIRIEPLVARRAGQGR